jgi:hypothetical protein
MSSGSTSDSVYSWKRHPDGQAVRLSMPFHGGEGRKAFIDIPANDSAAHHALASANGKTAKQIESHPALTRHLKKLHGAANLVGPLTADNDPRGITKESVMSQPDFHKIVSDAMNGSKYGSVLHSAVRGALKAHGLEDTHYVSHTPQGGTHIHDRKTGKIVHTVDSGNGPGIGDKSGSRTVRRESTSPKGKLHMTEKTRRRKADQLDETAASDTIQAHPTAETSKAGLMATLMAQAATMDVSKLQDMLAQIGHEADTIPDDAAARNLASIAPKGDAKAAMTQAMREDIDQLFGDQQLSEEFKEKSTVLFEAAVEARVIAVAQELQEQYESQLVEKTIEITEQLSQQVDMYLSHAVDTWLEQNEVAIESSLRNKITEQFVTQLGQLFMENNFIVPESDVDVVEALTDQVQELEAQLNDQIQENIEMTSVLEQFAQEEVFNEVSEGLTLTQVERLRTLSEGVEFEDVDSYKNKLAIIKENYFKKTTPSRGTLVESLTEVDPDNAPDNQEHEYVDPAVERYAAAIARTVKK